MLTIDWSLFQCKKNIYCQLSKYRDSNKFSILLIFTHIDKLWKNNILQNNSCMILKQHKQL